MVSENMHAQQRAAGLAFAGAPFGLAGDAER